MAIAYSEKGTIINDENSFKETLNFIKKYFENVKVINNKFSHLANRSQNYYKTILFKNRGCQFSIEWNHYSSTLYFGDINKNKNAAFQYSFTKMRLDNCYPIEENNNYNVVFWECELIAPHDDIGHEISPLRLPVTVKK
jgi:hypothetical protein